MPKAKPLSKEMVVAAMNKTKSNKAAARYLNVSYLHFKKWAKLYQDAETGQVLFDKHKNQSGKGIPKFLSNGNPRKDFALLDLIEGRIKLIIDFSWSFITLKTTIFVSSASFSSINI